MEGIASAEEELVSAPRGGEGDARFQSDSLIHV